MQATSPQPLIQTILPRLLSGEYPQTLVDELSPHPELLPGARDVFTLAQRRQRGRGLRRVVGGGVLCVLIAGVVIAAAQDGWAITGPGLAVGLFILVNGILKLNNAAQISRAARGIQTTGAGDVPSQAAVAGTAPTAASSEEAPVRYTISLGAFGAKNVLTLTADRFTSIATMQKVDIALSDVRYFCVEPVQAPNCDAYLVLSWEASGKKRYKKICVRAADQSFQRLIAALSARCPNASLMDLPPGKAFKQMGIWSLKKLSWVISLGIVAAILLAAVIMGVFFS